MPAARWRREAAPLDSVAMAVPPSTRRPRPGSAERPVNARMYRGTWLLLAIPLLLAAFSVARPSPLPEPFPPAFDAASAATLAEELATFYPMRLSGSDGAGRAAEWFRSQLEPYNLTVRTQPFAADVPGYGELRMTNLVATVRGRSDRRIVVMAHRDDLGIGPGAVDNASGTAALIVLARSFASPVAVEDPRQGPAHTLVFLSTDGGALGGYGAAHYAATEAEEIDAVINLDAIAGPGPTRLQLAGDRPRSSGWTLVSTASQRIAEQTGRLPLRPSAARQLLDLAFPYSLYEQAPFVGRGVSALTITTQGDAPGPAELDSEARLQRLLANPALRAAGRGRPDPDRLDRPGPRGDRRRPALPLLQHPRRPRLGRPARARRRPDPVPRRGRRSLRALPQATDPARACGAELPQPTRLLAVRRARVRDPRESRRLAARRPAARFLRRAQPPTSGRSARSWCSASCPSSPGSSPGTG